MVATILLIYETYIIIIIIFLIYFTFFPLSNKRVAAYIMAFSSILVTIEFTCCTESNEIRNFYGMMRILKGNHSLFSSILKD
jgi:hypothetical protein